MKNISGKLLYRFSLAARWSHKEVHNVFQNCFYRRRERANFINIYIAPTRSPAFIFLFFFCPTLQVRFVFTLPYVPYLPYLPNLILVLTKTINTTMSILPCFYPSLVITLSLEDPIQGRPLLTVKTTRVKPSLYNKEDFFYRLTKNILDLCN